MLMLLFLSVGESVSFAVLFSSHWGHARYGPPHAQFSQKRTTVWGSLYQFARSTLPRLFLVRISCFSPVAFYTCTIGNLFMVVVCFFPTGILRKTKCRSTLRPYLRNSPTPAPPRAVGEGRGGAFSPSPIDRGCTRSRPSRATEWKLTCVAAAVCRSSSHRGITCTFRGEMRVWLMVLYLNDLIP
jgi:hypothetical protein